METAHDTTQTRKAAVGGLAVVGFIALILIGIATAIYAASFLPKAFTRLSTANVYLSSVTQPATETTTNTNNSIPLSPATTTPATTQPAPTPTYTQTPSTPATTYTQPTYRTVAVPASQNYYGLPNLVTTITSVGYLRTDGDTNSFIADDTVPSGYQGAVRFVIANHGTNTSGSWYFDANLPGSGNSSDYHSDSQRSLNPGDSVVFTLGFDSSTRGRDTIRIEADPNDRVNESNEGDNTDSKSIYLNGGSSSTSSRDYDSNGKYCRYGTYYQNGRYYCESSSNNNGGDYDSNGNYCRYGTYYQNQRYYCNSSDNHNDGSYDSSGNYCRYGTYYQNGRYYCESSSSNNSNHYDSNGNYCQYGTYYSNGRYYCDTSSTYNGGDYDSNGNYCQYGTYYYNGRYYCS